MDYKIKPILFLIFILILGINAKAQVLNQSLQSLRGINKASIVVETFNQILHDSGLKEDDIRSDAWFELQSAGITILNEKASHDISGSPYLYINIGAVKSKNENMYAVSINVEFRQDVLLLREDKIKYYGAPTWSRSSIGIFTKDKISEVRKFTKDLVASFVKDYLFANKINNN